MNKLHLNDVYKLGKLGERLALRLNAKAFSNLAGNFHSKFRGQGLDFAAVRKYIAGDDIRNIDWKVTARTNKMHVKIFNEDRAREIYFLVDLGKEMLFASRGNLKAEQAIFSAAILAFAALQNHDRVGSYLISDIENIFCKASCSEKHIFKMLELMLKNLHNSIDNKDRNLKPYFADNINSIPRSLSKRAVIMLFTYIAKLTPEVKKSLSLLAHKREVFLFNIIDPLDRDIPQMDMISLQDGSNNLAFSINAETQKAYQHSFLARQDELTEFCKRQKIFYQLINTETSIFSQIESFMRRI